MTMRELTLTILVALLWWSVDSAKILGIFNVPSYSHYTLGKVILKELARKGHEITVISSFIEEAPLKNYKQVYLTGIYEKLKQKSVNKFEETEENIIKKAVYYDFVGIIMTEDVLKHPNVQQLLKSNQTFDLVIMEQFLNEAFRGFCYKYQAPCVVLSTIGGSIWTNPQMGNLQLPSYVPDMFLNLPSNMNFYERLYNSLVYAFRILIRTFYTFPKHNDLLHKYFPHAPHLNDLYYNTSLMLLNSHVSINPPVPYVPNMIEIGGFHVNPPKELSVEIKKYLDEAQEGVVYFSLGSFINSKDLPQDKLEAILKVFSNIKQKVLWKWENDVLPGIPHNVKVAKWVSQQDVLAHPNTKLFVTHGGLLSLIEAIYYAKPILGVPVFGDQLMNVANAKTSGFGVELLYKNLNENTFKAALEEALNNHTYTRNIQERSRILDDEPMKPLDKAVFWIEYVIRHRGAPHLRTSALNLTWCQHLLLDVVGFLVFIVLLSIYFVYKICKIVQKKKVLIQESRHKKNM